MSDLRDCCEKETIPLVIKKRACEPSMENGLAITELTAANKLQTLARIGIADNATEPNGPSKKRSQWGKYENIKRCSQLRESLIFAFARGLRANYVSVSKARNH